MEIIAYFDISFVSLQSHPKQIGKVLNKPFKKEKNMLRAD